MLLYITIILLILTFVFTYKNLRNTSTKFLYGIIIGWTISIIAFILYLSTHSYSYNLVNRLFYFPSLLWNQLILMDLNPIMILRLFNIGIMLFVYSVLCFSIAFSGKNRLRIPNHYIYLLLSILPAIELIFYDPQIQILLQQYYNQSAYGIPEYNLLISKVSMLFHTINWLYILIAFIIMIYYYYKYPKIRFLRNYTLYNILCLIPIGIIFLSMFSWAPDVLLKITVVNGYYNFQVPNLSNTIMMFNSFPIIVILVFLLILIALYRFNAIENYYKDKNIHINRSIDTASLGMRVFTHSIKNHLLVIRSESEYLMELLADHKEAMYSLETIHQSCTSSFDTLTDATKKLKSVELKLCQCELKTIILSALNQLHIPSRISLQLKLIDDPIAYVDETQLIEVIINLTNNAIDAIGNKTEGIITITLEAQNNWATISITDTGTGIDEGMLAQIFQPFFSTKNSLNNWGIGLSYCHKIIDAHDGEITVESTKDHGATFKINLPQL
ncbi:sensor histidine kinase [Vallitalea okinawensis]|uniref:sensor histidine kinase n=1 Tax=Vallitalea okinawensis TaxID=2078660 RepID=UPI000CFCA35D|nr:HAMP domain-containing sensor histidine kinase [Vallitalea okinawensis]